MKIDVIAMDFDGTLLNSSSCISDYTVQVLQKASQKGIHIIGVSGRPQASMLPYLRKLNVNEPYIGANGSQIVNSDHQIIETADIDKDLLYQVCSQIEDDGIYAQIYDGENLYYNKECEHSRRYLSISKMNGKCVGNLRTFVSKSSPKVVCVDTPENILMWKEKYKALFGDRINVTSSLITYMELLPLGVNKGTALKRLCKLFSYNPENLMAFGDGENDISMLQYAGYGIAMGNAVEAVKSSADFVCDTNDNDGLARFVEEQVLRG